MAAQATPAAGSGRVRRDQRSVVTGLSGNFALALAARFAAGLFAGVLWAIIAPHARRMAAPHQQGKALTIALAGTPIALAIGTAVGTLLAGLIGWRATFAVMTLLAGLVIAWVLAAVPDFPGQAKGERTPVGRVFAIPGVVPVLAAVFLYVMAHNVLYTYIASFVAPVGLGGSVSAVLLVFGVALASIWITGVLIDRPLRLLMISSTALFALAVLALGLLASLPVVVFLSAALWGLAFGGAASLLQTAGSNAAGDAVDSVQPVIVTVWKHRHRRRRCRGRTPPRRPRSLVPGLGNPRAPGRCAAVRPAMAAITRRP
ncbi:MFS transporter [Streptomyces sp. NBC_00365]|uniref:MFS transporter n=1 Tax=Streptomyces sp. NBC_00365 TaxID=2975726 RepID=UPI00225647C7|nr:MFS transporter [Streptomyces sp. NBC_00365]MCX5094014.1 MFS transporter [Streptomyces sp. NBC_00365]